MLSSRNATKKGKEPKKVLVKKIWSKKMPTRRPPNRQIGIKEKAENGRPTEFVNQVCYRSYWERSTLTIPWMWTAPTEAQRQRKTGNRELSLPGCTASR
ncbi:Hypothetical protein SMAX5B_008051 [Scophthalmus maximus]|uniref:Uncharacterized protein n=1 Tax=Scophthalmus maximus TaxID=52904 RepID=A0A2U9BEM1_SCOMX|nr:Hypothetical protein SMAX5B_008051 [Scophthalmus maximus]